VQPRKAYTLMEVVLVVAIIAIVAGISYPNIMSMYSHYRLRAGSDIVRAGWVGARAHAVEEGQRYRFSVVSGKGNFRVAPDSPSYWSGALPDFDRDNPPLIMEDSLPSGIVFTFEGDGAAPATGSDGGDSTVAIGSVDPGMWQTVAIFEPDGTAQEDVTITLRSAGGRPVVVSLRALTAISSSKMGPVEGQR
jgi:prepilin-type N-terminal cleavage/methylation domain-containing protein